MNILSFVYGRECHDTSAAVVCDGVLLAASEEERFSRRKHDSAFPFQSIDFCLRATGLSMEKIDYIAFPDKPYRTGPDSYLAAIDLDSLRQLHSRHNSTLLSLIHKRVLDPAIRMGLAVNCRMDRKVADGFSQLRKRYARIPPVRYYDHHHAHAAAAYLTSGMDAAAIVTADFSGGPFSTVTWKGESLSITRLHTVPWDNSLGEFYWDTTRYLGFGSFAEGKTMGLAAYGDTRVFAPLFHSVLRSDGIHEYSYLGWPSDGILGAPERTSGSPLDAPYPEIASAAQCALERVEEGIVRGATEKANCGNLCLGGGVALNCSANGALLKHGLADSVWVFPASSDAGLAVGAALLCSAEQGELRPARLNHAYLGPDCGPQVCATALEREPRVAICGYAGPLEETVAAALAQGQVVGVCRGRMEFGPRALGNRSILADPRSNETRDRVNRLKGRELWRPLAPSVLAERASDFFDLCQPSPFMLIRADVHPAMRTVIPGVVHVDGSARPQTVTREQNAFFYDLISAFGRRSGIPILLNTSFNIATEPIVCDPEDAIRTFLAAGLDLLVLGDLLVRRSA